MKFLRPTWKKILFTTVFFCALAYIAMQFGTQGFVYSDETPIENQPIHFKLNPVLWLPSWYVYKGEITDFTIFKSMILITPYWLIISYLISSIIFPPRFDGDKKGSIK